MAEPAQTDEIHRLGLDVLDVYRSIPSAAYVRLAALHRLGCFVERFSRRGQCHRKTRPNLACIKGDGGNIGCGGRRALEVGVGGRVEVMTEPAQTDNIHRLGLDVLDASRHSRAAALHRFGCFVGRFWRRDHCHRKTGI